MENNSVNVKVEKLPKSVIKLTITADKDEMPKAIDKAYTKLSKNVEVKGFRKGAAPKHLIIAELGEKLYEEAFNVMLWSLSDKAIAQEKLTPLSQPEYAMVEMDPSKPFSFTMQFAVYPEVLIGDLKAIKVDKEEILKAKAERDRIKEESNKSNESKTIEQESQNTDTVNKEEDQIDKEVKDTKVAKFSLEEYYSKILEEIFNKSTIEIPDAIIERELSDHVHNFSHKLEELGISTTDYLKLQNLTLEDAKKGWRSDIEFSLKQDVLLEKYAIDNKIEVKDEEVKKNLESAYPPEEIEKLDHNMYNYVRNALLRQKAFLDLITLIEKNNGIDTNSNSN